MFEPSQGGDVRIELPGQRVVEQWKARTTNKPWSLQEIVAKVLPDLYLDPALEAPDDETEYVFATEGYLAESAQASLKRLVGPMLESDPLTGLSEEDWKLLKEASKAVRHRKQFRSESDSLTYPKLRRLLSRFKVREGQKAQDLAQDINNWLLPLVDHREEIGAKRERLCMLILSKAAQGEVVIVPEDLLREAGLRGVSLESVNELRRRAREVVKREVERRKYDRDHDVRTVPSWPENKPFLVMAGESGQGKTWQLARLALGLAGEGDSNKILTIFLVSQEDVTRDLEQAADLLWKQAWDRDQFKSLDRVAAHWWEVQEDTEQPWLAVCVDNVQSLSRARALIDTFDWERWGIRLAISVPKEIGVQLAGERPDQVQLHLLRDFTLPELREYLRRYSRNSEELPADVRETLRRPLLAGIYATIGSDPEWRPIREYQIYEEYWRWLQTTKEQAEHPEDLVRVKRLALSLLDEEPHYPWTWEQLDAAGLTGEPRLRLERAGWWVRVETGMEVWHDRLLSWALAEAVAERGRGEELAAWLRRDPRPQNPRIRRILAYLPLDVLWLLSGNPAKIHLVPDLILLREEEDEPFGWHRLYEEDLPSLGRRIVPSLLNRLRRLPDDARYSYHNLAVTSISKIFDREAEGREDLPRLLEEPSRVVRDVAVGTLARHPHPEAVALLWDRLQSSSRSVEQSQGTEGLTTYQMTLPALRASLNLNPSWLKAKILEADPEQDQVWELAYLLASLKHPTARSIWLEVKGELFRKMPPHKLRSLAVCIRVFLDGEEVPRLESLLFVEEDWTDLTAFRALAWVAPDRAVQLIATLPLKNLSDHHFGSWLPILLLKRPTETRRALRDRMEASELEFWEVADLYRWYEEMIDRDTVESLLDRLSMDSTRDSLRRPLNVLSRLHRVDLLQALEDRAGKNLDRRLGDIGAAYEVSANHLDFNELRSVLLKIAGEGIRRLILAGLASSDSARQREALVWGRMFPEEIASASPRDPAAHALLGENKDLVESIIALEFENPWNQSWRREWLTTLWRLRRGKPPMTDEDLAPAFEVLRVGDMKKRMRGLDAVSISGRADLLSLLPQWLEGLAALEEIDLKELDWRASYLVRRLAEENSKGVEWLSEALNFECFPLILEVLYGQVGAEALPNLLEQHLLSHLEPGRFGRVEMHFALILSHSRGLDPAVQWEVWKYGREDDGWNRSVFWKAVAGLDSEEVREELWKASQDRNPMEDERIEAIPALALWNPDAAFDIAARHLREPGPNRSEFVRLLMDLDPERGVPLLIEQAVGERQTETLWIIARSLRRVRHAIDREIQARLESPDYRIRKAAAHLTGWIGPAFFEVDLQRMAEEDPDSDVQWECLQAMDRQYKERCVLELMDAFRKAEGSTRWSYLESILELGDPYLLTTEGDPLWLARILQPEEGVFEVHSKLRLKERFKEVKRAAKRRDDED